MGIDRLFGDSGNLDAELRKPLGGDLHAPAREIVPEGGVGDFERPDDRALRVPGADGFQCGAELRQVHLRTRRRHPVGALAAAAGAALLAAASPHRWSRLIFHALAALSALVAIHLTVYRVDADQSGLASRGLLGRTRIPWGEVAGVDGDAGLVVVTGRDKRRIRVDTADFRPEQRATLDRTIARRVRESSAK